MAPIIHQVDSRGEHGVQEGYRVDEGTKLYKQGWDNRFRLVHGQDVEQVPTDRE